MRESYSVAGKMKGRLPAASETVRALRTSGKRKGGVSMLELLMFGVAVGGIGGGYVKVRKFVRERLRYVDGLHGRGAPWLAGVGAVLLATPLVWVLPVLGAGTALLFGAGVGLAVAHGARDVRTHHFLPDSP
jgi:hypothetical protein